MAKKAPAKKAAKVPKRKPVTGFSPLKFQDHTITQKRSGRFQVVTAKGKTVNGADKTSLLLADKVLIGPFKKAVAEQTMSASN